jgi:hypothetical protein
MRPPGRGERIPTGGHVPVCLLLLGDPYRWIDRRVRRDLHSFHLPKIELQIPILEFAVTPLTGLGGIAEKPHHPLAGWGTLQYSDSFNWG